MAVHDPESGIQEEQKALKAGRKRRIRIIDGKEVYEDVDIKDEDEDYEDEEENDDDGQQYVVLEVIQMPDGQQQHQEKQVPSDVEEEQEEEEEEIEETEEIGLEHDDIEMLVDGQDESFLVEEGR
jgi:transcriptional repressor CTCF